MASNHGPMAALRSELIAALSDWGVAPDTLRDGRRSLIRTGALDSVALFNLSVWIEEKLGRRVDPTSFDVVEAWDSADAIMAFLARESGAIASTDDSRTAAPAPTLAPAPAHQKPATATRAVDGGKHGSEYVLARYTREYRSEVARLLTVLWSPDPDLNERVFSWKYEQNPFSTEPLIYLALSRGKPVGMRALYETLWQASGAGEPVSVYCADDFVVDAAHQNQGLYAMFGECAARDLADANHEFFVSLSALRVTRLQSLAHGAQSVPVPAPQGRQSRWAGTADRILLLARQVPGLWRLADVLPGGELASTSFSRLDASAVPATIGDLTLEVARRPQPEAMAALVARLPHDGRIRQIRDARFFSWRYAHPLHDYRFVLAHRGRQLAGYLVLQRGLSALANQRRTNVVDWAVDDSAAFGRMIEFALRSGRFAELVSWSDAGDAPYATALRKQGFVPTDKHQTERGLPCILVHPLTTSMSALEIGERPLLDPASWDLRMAYTSYV
jgi:GNAT superfamily N-acetyltransferase/acyl carrier protein